jgi:hypothetical protein
VEDNELKSVKPVILLWVNLGKRSTSRDELAQETQQPQQAIPEIAKPRYRFRRLVEGEPFTNGDL